MSHFSCIRFGPMCFKMRGTLSACALQRSEAGGFRFVFSFFVADSVSFWVWFVFWIKILKAGRRPDQTGHQACQEDRRDRA